MLKKFYHYITKLHKKILLFIIYLFLFSPIFITFILNKNTIFQNANKFLFFFIIIITILSFSAIAIVYYCNFFLDKKINQKKFSKTNHLKKIFLSYLYIICIFANLFYMAQYTQNITREQIQDKNYYFDFNKNNLSYTNNIDLFANCFYLSITTITTIGYGFVVPIHIYGKFLIAVEAILGQIIWGLSIALWFVKGRL